MPGSRLQAATEAEKTETHPCTQENPGPVDETESRQGGGHLAHLGDCESRRGISQTWKVGADLETQQKRGKGIQAADGWGRE